MRAFTQALIVLFAGLLLASCGGGGGGGGDSGFNPPGLTVAVTTASASTTPNSLVGITVRVTGAGNAVADGTVVTLQVSPPGVGLVSTTAPTTTIGERATSNTAGGIATFRLHSRAIGTATLTASVPDPNAPGRTVTGTGTIAVQAGPPQDPRLQIQLQTATLPVNPNFIDPFIGSPYLSEAVITWRKLDGSFAPACTDCVSVATTSQGSQNIVITFSTPDDPSTDDINEFLLRLQSAPTDVNGGRTVAYVLSQDRAGVGLLSATAIDPDTQETVYAQATITVSNGTPGLPASILIGEFTAPVYIAGVNGPHTTGVRTTVFDGGLTTVPNPPAGVNNVRLEIVGGGADGERLRGTSASGATQTGGAISIPSFNGFADAAYEAGTRAGFVTLRATADRADNNVDNGITDPVTSTRQETVSDGRIFDIDIASPPNVIASTAVLAPLSGSDTYQMFVEAVATDRFGGGRPPAPGSEISWGLIDFPLNAQGTFAIAGGDGDPQEGGTLFTAPTGAFTTAGGGAGPGDTLIVFGEESTGNRDLESARTVTAVNSATSLTVQSRFNFNDDTGSSVNNGPVLPYIIGRPVDANVIGASTTDANGRARSIVTYGRSKLGKRFALWARGQGDFINNSPELVTDAELLRLQGSGPLSIIAPSALQANRTIDVRVCVEDSTGTGIQGVLIDYAVQFTSGGSFTIDGSSAATGTVDNATGADGCTLVRVVTSGVVQSGTAGTITWSVDDAEAETEIIGPQNLVLIATPGSVVVGAGTGTVGIQLCLTDGSGGGVSGVNIQATCTATGGASLQPGGIIPTGADGCTLAGVTYSDFVIDPDGNPTTPPVLNSGSCTFRAGAQGPSVVVPFQGARTCGDGFSPPPPGCGP
jgi:hypothetical protein